MNPVHALQGRSIRSAVLIKQKDNNMKEEQVAQFVKEHGIACGGNWAAMLMSAIKRGLPEVFKGMEDKEYEFDELYVIIADSLEA
jgi:aerobic-type carbon monoxide dehydrogenase small subunit (CoxS/CutS family)